MKKLLFILFLVGSISFGQNVAPGQYDSKKSREIKYYGKNFFSLEGTLIPDSLKQNRYDRLPISYKDIVRKPVWDLSKSSAGMSIRFISNSNVISVKWTILNDLKMNHMPDTGIKGIDLYFKNKDKWQYINTGRPEGIKNESILIDNMTEKMREFKIFLPLYDGIVNIEVGIDSESIIKKPLKKNKKTIIFYGTSITQGGCASRPGMAHTNIISRKLDFDCVNFGFSGNGIMEQPIAKLISESKPLFYVIECMPNMINAENVTNKTIPLVDTIRENNTEAPIVLVDYFIPTTSILDKKTENEIRGMNLALKTEYEKMISEGYNNILYVKSKNAIGDDNEGTVDGVHFTDLGFIRYANFLIDKFVEFGLIDIKQVL
ncbi:SGNH/GDSL hydrolase family protein [Flavobacteriaceae bacterium]|nr:SGNH/GDSL hydrolase family protein [Flavobacteriaceae bacterium]